MWCDRDELGGHVMRGLVVASLFVASLALPAAARAMNHEVHVNGMYRGHMSNDPDGGHVAVKDAAVTGESCS